MLGCQVHLNPFGLSRRFHDLKRRSNIGVNTHFRLSEGVRPVLRPVLFQNMKNKEYSLFVILYSITAITSQRDGLSSSDTRENVNGLAQPLALSLWESESHWLELTSRWTWTYSTFTIVIVSL